MKKISGIFFNQLFRLYKSALRWPKTWLFFALIVFLTFCSQLGTLKTAITIDDLLDPEFATSKTYAELKRLFSAKLSVMAVFEPVPSSRQFTDAEIDGIESFITQVRVYESEVEQVISPFDIRKPVEQGNILLYLPVLSQDADGKYEGFEELRKTPWGGVLFSQNSNDFAAEIIYRKIDSSNPEVLNSLFDRWNKTSTSKNVNVRWLGSAAYPYYMLEGIKKDSIRNIIIIILLLCGLRILFGTWKSGFIFISTLVFTGLLTYGGMAVFGSPLDAISNSLFLMIAVAALEDFIFISYARMESGENWKKPFRQIIIPGFLTSLTTFIGFASLLVSDLSIIRRFGLWAAVASIIEWVAVFLLLPALLKCTPSLRQWTDSSKAKFYIATGNLGKKILPRKWALMSLLIMPLAAYSVLHLNVNDTPELIFKDGHPFKEGVRYMSETRGWRGEVSLVFGNYKEKESNRKIIDEVKKIDGVIKVESPYEMEDYLVKGKEKITADLVLRDLSNSRMYKRLVSGEGTARAIMYLKSMEVREINRIEREVKKICNHAGQAIDRDCYVSGNLMAYGEFSEKVPQTLLESLVLSLILVTAVIVFLSLALREPQIVPVILSCIWGPSVMLASLVVFDVRINFITCIFATVLIGLTGDNAIQYLWAGRKRGLLRGIQERGVGSIQCALLMFMGSLTFIYSYFDPPRTFGILLGSGFLIALIGDLWILKSLFKKEQVL